MSRGPCSGSRRAPSMKVPPGVPRSSRPRRPPAISSRACGRPTDGSGTESSVGCAAGRAGQDIGWPTIRRGRASRRRRLQPPAPPIGQRRGWRRQRARWRGPRPVHRPAPRRSRGLRIRGFIARPAHEGEHPQQDQRHDRADTPASVSRIAPSPAQPGRPAFSTMRHAIQAASTARDQRRRRWSGRRSPSGRRSRRPSLSALPARLRRSASR